MALRLASAPGFPWELPCPGNAPRSTCSGARAGARAWWRQSQGHQGTGGEDRQEGHY